MKKKKTHKIKLEFFLFNKFDLNLLCVYSSSIQRVIPSIIWIPYTIWAIYSNLTIKTLNKTLKLILF